LPKEYNDTIKLVDIKTLKFLEDTINSIINSEDYDGITTETDIETALHINIEGKSINEVMDYLDEMPIKDTSDIMKTLKETLPRCDLEYNTSCKKCRKEVKFVIDLSQDIFEELLR